jgi:ecotin
MIESYTMKKSLLGLALTISVMVSNGSPEHPELKAFPEAEEGQVRHVFVLPEKTRQEEVDFKVELIPGKVMETDGVNRIWLGVTLESRSVKGWGYTFYDVTGKDIAMSTRIGVPPGTPRVEKFVAGNPLMIRYNSRLPVVIYAPKGFKIRYRIWEAGKEQAISE